MIDRGFFLTRQAIRRQLAAMPNELFLIRLIHSGTGNCCAGERLWTATLLTTEATVRFLRARNRQGFDIYIYPYAENRNSGYILVDLDRADPHVLCIMRAHGHEPCVVLQSSPGHFQAWIRVSDSPLVPALATAIGRYLAHAYQADSASADWRHLGRLAGFTNQKPQRRRPSGYAPWVKLLHAQAGLATHSAALVQAAQRQLADRALAAVPSDFPILAPLDPGFPSSAAAATYQAWLRRLHIPQRFPEPDWSIADKWVAKELLRRGAPQSQVHAILQFGSPGFPRRHADPQDYLRRTLARAAMELQSSPFPGRQTPRFPSA
jgi:hypothetical protein